MQLVSNSGNTPLSSFERRLDPTQLPKKPNSNGDICSRTRAGPDPNHMKCF